MKKSILAVVCILGGLALAPAPAQEGVGEKIGERIDRGLDKLGNELKQSWSDIRNSVEGLGVQGRTYSRLHWDKGLKSAAIEIEVRDRDVVVLKGSVPTGEAKRKAVQLARDTVGVASVVDELTVAAAE